MPEPAKKHIAIAWLGLPYYAANVIRAVRETFTDCEITVISRKANVAYSYDEMERVGSEGHLG
jgi:hypothetical protein